MALWKLCRQRNRLLLYGHICQIHQWMPKLGGQMIFVVMVEVTLRGILFRESMDLCVLNRMGGLGCTFHNWMSLLDWSSLMLDRQSSQIDKWMTLLRCERPLLVSLMRLISGGLGCLYGQIRQVHKRMALRKLVSNWCLLLVDGQVCQTHHWMTMSGVSLLGGSWNWNCGWLLLVNC